MKDDKWASDRDDFPEKPRRDDDFGEYDEFAEFDANDETARRIRNAFAAARTSLPADFFESRLKKTLDESPVWARFEQNGAAASVAVRPGVFREKRSETRRGRQALWLGAGSAAAVAIGAAFVVGWNGFGSNDGGQNGDLAQTERNVAPVAEFEAPENEANDSTEKKERTTDGFVFRMPLPEGSVAVTPSRSEDEFWATFPVAKDDLRAFGGEFSRFCLRRDINIDKFDGDAEFLLKNVTPKIGGEIAAWFREKAEKSAATPSSESVENGSTSKTPGWRASKAFERWLETAASGDRTQNVRVSLVPLENDGE